LTLQQLEPLLVQLCTLINDVLTGVFSLCRARMFVIGYLLSSVIRRGSNPPGISKGEP
jgi:hypothetical protein